MKFLFISIGLLILTASVSGQNKMDDIISKYNSGNYQEVIRLGQNYRQTLGGRGIPALDYMILTSLCMDESKKKDACKLSDLIMNDYYKGLSDKEFSLMKTGFESFCNAQAKPMFDVAGQLKNIQYADNYRQSRTKFEFKSYLIMYNGFLDHPGFKNITADVVKQVTYATIKKTDSIKAFNAKQIDDLIKRRCPKNNQIALNRTLARFGENVKHFKSSNFLIITPLDNHLNLSNIAMALEKVLAFYKKYYGFDDMPALITIYLTKESYKVAPTIRNIYLANPSEGILGYSNCFDNSVVAWIPNSIGIGTLKHELIHLMVKSRFNRVPHWFEEGLAELYEQSIFRQDTLIGEDNWRLQLLKSDLFNYPLISLVNNSKFSPTKEDKAAMEEKAKSYIVQWSSTVYQSEMYAVDNSIQLFISNYFPLYKDALSRYFVMYLQEKNTLQPFYNKLYIRDNDIFNLQNYKTTEDLILEACKQDSFDHLQNDFKTWLEKKQKG